MAKKEKPKEVVLMPLGDVGFQDVQHKIFVLEQRNAALQKRVAALEKEKKAKPNKTETK